MLEYCDIFREITKLYWLYYMQPLSYYKLEFWWNTELHSVVYVNIHLILLLFKYFKMSLLTGPGQFSSCLEVWFYGNQKKTRKFELVHLYSGLTWNSVFADTSFWKQIAMLTLLRMSVIGVLHQFHNRFSQSRRRPMLTNRSTYCGVNVCLA